MEQNTNEWLEYRRAGLGASDIPIIMGVSPYRTRFELWEEKTGRNIPEQTTNFVQQKGHDIEILARNWYEIKTGKIWEPAMVEHAEFPHFRASLDGYNAELNACWEAKFAGKEVIELCEKGIVHEKYYPQVQWQMFVTGAVENHFHCNDGDGKNYVAIIKPDIPYIKKMLKEVNAFWELVKTETAPALTKKDVVEIKDESITPLFARYKELKAQANELKEIEKTILEHVKGFKSEASFQFGNVKITNIERKGTIDYKKLLKEKEISEDEAEKFRKRKTKSYSIRLLKEKEND